MPKVERHGQASVLSESDYTKLLKNIKNEKHRLFLLVARFTGERWGAICQLRVGDVYRNQQKGEIHTHITFRAATRKADPSGLRETRQVPIHPNLAVALKAYRLAEGQEWLFPGWLDPSRPMSRRNADKFLRVAAEKAGLEGVSCHSTRRTLITNLSRVGVATTVIQKITGHRDLKSLQRYVEVSDDQLKEAVCLL